MGEMTLVVGLDIILSDASVPVILLLPLTEKSREKKIAERLADKAS